MLSISWVILTIVLSGAHGVVLCIGDDGHVALEVVHQGHCQDTHGADEHGQEAVPKQLAGTDARCCPSCVDVPLSSGTMFQFAPEVKRRVSAAHGMANTLTASAATATAGARSNPSPASFVPPQKPTRASPALLAQRTIVLRI